MERRFGGNDLMAKLRYITLPSGQIKSSISNEVLIKHFTELAKRSKSLQTRLDYLDILGLLGKHCSPRITDSDIRMGKKI